MLRTSRPLLVTTTGVLVLIFAQVIPHTREQSMQTTVPAPPSSDLGGAGSVSDVSRHAFGHPFPTLPSSSAPRLRLVTRCLTKIGLLHQHQRPRAMD